MDQRGQLSSLDLVPDAGRDAIAWAMGELNARRRTQADILFELNDRLEAVGCERISKSAFNRAAMRAAIAKSRAEERSAVIAAVAPMATPGKVAEADIVVAEMLKTLVMAILDREELTSEDALNLARAHQKAVEAQTQSAELRRVAQAEFDAKLGNAAEAVSKAKGLTADTRKKIMEQLGVIQKAV